MIQKKVFTSLILLSSLSFAHILTASNSTTSKQQKSSKPHYGVIDMQRIILSVEEAKVIREKMESMIKEKEQELKEQKEELENMHAQFQKDANLLSEEARNKKQQEIQEKLMRLRNSEVSIQNELKQKEMEATQQIVFKVKKIISPLAEQQSLVMVYEKNAGLLYVKDPVDLTEKVILEYNKQHSVKKKLISTTKPSTKK